MIVPALLLSATAVAVGTDNLLGKRDNDQAFQMFQAANRLATVVESSTSMTKADKVDSSSLQDTVICPLAEDVADMVSKALKEAGDSPQNQTRQIMQKLVRISSAVQKVADNADVSCDGLSDLKEQSDKVKSAVEDDTDDDSDNDDDSDSDEESDTDEDSLTTVTALAVSNKKWMAAYNGVEHLQSLPDDYLCDSIDTAAKSIEKMNNEVNSNTGNNTKGLIENGVIELGKNFTSSADDNNIKCDSQLSSLNNALNKNASRNSTSTSSSSSTSSSASSSASGSTTASQDSDSGAAGISNNVVYLTAGVIAALALL